MLVHFDSSDLINVFKGKPFGPNELMSQLVERNMTLIYSPETIQEVVKPSDLSESRIRLKTLLTFPRRYIREKKEIFRREFVAAFSVFNNTSPAFNLSDINPYVDTWQEVDQPLDRQFGTSRDFLVEIIIPLLESSPDRFRNTSDRHNVFMSQVTHDRRSGNNIRSGPIDSFRDSVGYTLIQLGLLPQSVAPDLVDGLAAWLYQNPLVCPSWRLMGETYAEFAGNMTDRGQFGDQPDFAHVSVAPYVDAITLDARMRGYVKAASRRLSLIDDRIDYDKRVFENVNDLLFSSTAN